MPPAKQQIKERLHAQVDFEGSLDSIIQKIQNFKTEHPGYDDLIIESEYYGYEGAYDLVLYGVRMETDLELANRRCAEQREKRRVKQKELETIEKQIRKAKLSRDELDTLIADLEAGR